MVKKILDESVHEIKKITTKSPIVFAGFVGPGLAGPLAVGFMIEKLKMTRSEEHTSELQSH